MSRWRNRSPPLALLRDVVQGSSFEGRVEDGLLALSELVTNAVLHGRKPITLTVGRSHDTLRIEVADGNPLSPSFSMLHRTAVTGRGLLLISAVSDRFGVEPSLPGKVVWCELLAGRDTQTTLDVDALLASLGGTTRPTRPSGSWSPISTSPWWLVRRRTSRACCAS